MNSLFIHFPLDTNTQDTNESDLHFHYITSVDGEHIATSGSATASELSKLPNQKVIVVLPIEGISWHQVQFPKGVLDRRFFHRSSAATVRTILENLLEDELLDAPDTLHFSLEPMAGTYERQVVAVCRKAWLQQGLDILRNAGISIHRIIPKFSPVRKDEDIASIENDDGSENLSLVREAYLLGDMDNARIVKITAKYVSQLPLNASTAHLCLVNDHTKLWSEPAVAYLAQEFFQQEAELMAPGQRCFAAADGDWNLAQFEFAQNTDISWHRRLLQRAKNFWSAPAYRYTRLFLGLLIAINLVGLNVSALLASHRMKSKSNELYTIFRTTFPSITTVVDIPIQMDRAMRQLTASSGELSPDDAESLLNILGSATKGSRVGAQVLNYSTSSHVLQLQGVQIDGGQLKIINDQIARRGYVAELAGTTLTIKALK
jgi:general secretion pathway protein L